MKKLKFIVALLASAFMALSIGTAVASITGINPLAIAGPVFLVPPALKLISSAIGVPMMPQGYAFMAIQQEIWVDYIIGNLFKENSFTTKCFDESDGVLAGAVVHIPQAGAKPTVVKNRSVFPATAVRRTDTDITYPLDVYSTDPVHITNAEENEISYDKMSSVIGEHVDALIESYADDLLYKWAPTDTAYILRTTGAADATALAPGATGNRKKFLKEDLKRAQVLMNKQNIPKEERYAIVPSDIYAQLLDDSDLKQRDGAYGNEVDLKNGIVMKLYGFNLMERSDTTIYTNATPPVPKAPGSATAITDNMSVICWQKNQVAKALGSVKMFENTNDATYYGDVYSAEVKLGGRKRRTSGAGVVAIVQEP